MKIITCYFTNASQLRPFNNAFRTMLYLIGRLSSIESASVTEPRNCTHNLADKSLAKNVIYRNWSNDNKILRSHGEKKFTIRGGFLCAIVIRLRLFWCNFIQLQPHRKFSRDFSLTSKLNLEINSFLFTSASGGDSVKFSDSFTRSCFFPLHLLIRLDKLCSHHIWFGKKANYGRY